MKTTLSITRYFILSIFLLFSCSSDNDSSDSTELSVQNFVTTVDENQADATSLGTIQATGEGTLSFSITSQTPAGALTINASTGELTVADASAFDFETNPVINGTISVIDTQSTVNATMAININDVDGVFDALLTSQADYTAAANGDWVMITEAEYNALADNLNEVSRSGTNETQYNTAPAVTTGGAGYTRANITSTSIIPNGSYVFAFKYKTNNVANDTNSKVKQSSTANNDGFSDLGSSLPSHSGTGEDVFFVLKDSDNPVSATGYLSIYNNSKMSIIVDPNNIGYYFVLGDSSPTLTGNSTSYINLYQGLSTTQMQW